MTRGHGGNHLCWSTRPVIGSVWLHGYNCNSTRHSNKFILSFNWGCSLTKNVFNSAGCSLKKPQEPCWASCLVPFLGLHLLCLGIPVKSVLSLHKLHIGSLALSVRWLLSSSNWKFNVGYHQNFRSISVCIQCQPLTLLFSPTIFPISSFEIIIVENSGALLHGGNEGDWFHAPCFDALEMLHWKFTILFIGRVPASTKEKMSWCPCPIKN